MKCVFVGSLKEDSGYIVEVLQEKEYEIIQAGEYDQIENDQSGFGISGRDCGV